MSKVGFNGYARILIQGLDVEVFYGNVSPETATRILKPVLEALLDDGWEPEEAQGILERFADHDWIVGVFRENEIYLPCGAHEVLEDGGEEGGNWGIWVTCVLPKDHTVDHFDDNEDLTWPVTKP